MPVVTVSGFPLQITFQHLLKSLQQILDTNEFWLNESSDSPDTGTKQAQLEFRTSHLALMARNSLDDFAFDYYGEKYPLFAYYNQEDDPTFAPNYRGGPSSFRSGMQRGSRGSAYGRTREQEERPQRGIQRGRGQSRPYNGPTGLHIGRGLSRPHYDGPRGEPRSQFDDPSDLPRPHEMHTEKTPKYDNYNSQSSKLDLELELLRKKRLVIEEETKLLMEKKKLEQIRESGPNDLFHGEGRGRGYHMQPVRGFRGAGPFRGLASFRGAGPFRGLGSFRGGRGNYRQDISFPPPERSGYPRYKRPEPDHFPIYPQDFKTRRYEYNHTHPSLKFKAAKGPSLPLFHTACNILVEEMKAHIVGGSNTKTKKLTNKIKSILRSRLGVALEHQEKLLTGIEKAKLYRTLYSPSTDKPMIDKILQEMVEKRQAKLAKKSDNPEADDLNTTVNSDDDDEEDEINKGNDNATLQTVDLDSTLNRVDEKMEVDSRIEAYLTLDDAKSKTADITLGEVSLDDAEKTLEGISDAAFTPLEGDKLEEEEAASLLGSKDKAQLNADVA